MANGVFVDRKKENETKNHPNDQDAIIEGVSGGGGDDDGSQSGGKGYGGIVERINTLVSEWLQIFSFFLFYDFLF